MSEREITVEATVRIVTSDDAPADWLTLVTEPDFPYKIQGGRAMTEAEGINHLAYNAVANGVHDAARLDGWADLERGVVTMDVTWVEAV
jgi:hypothetical protein